MSVSSLSGVSSSASVWPASRPVAADAAGQAAGARKGSQGQGLSEADLRLVEQLKARDREVRAHELAHMAAGSGLVTRGASYTYQTGPDGQRYAVGGEVGIDVSKGRTPEETVRKAEQIRSAALAPAQPSAQDRQVAAEAGRMAMEARMEMASASDNAGKPKAVESAYGASNPDQTSAGARVDTYA